MTQAAGTAVSESHHDHDDPTAAADGNLSGIMMISYGVLTAVRDRDRPTVPVTVTVTVIRVVRHLETRPSRDISGLSKGHDHIVSILCISICPFG